MSGHPSIRRQLTDAYRRIAELGLTDLSSGNISVRVDGGMLISASGISSATVSADSFVFVADDGSFDIDGRRPSSEWQMHLAVYRAKRSAGAVVHTHSDHCVALASHGRGLPGFTYVVGFFGGSDVPCVPYSTFGSQQLAEDAAAALVELSACLLANHGAIARGRDLGSAVDGAHLLEILCRQYLAALQIGEPRHLSDEEWAAFFAQAVALDYGNNPRRRQVTE